MIGKIAAYLIVFGLPAVWLAGIAYVHWRGWQAEMTDNDKLCVALFALVFVAMAARGLVLD